VTPENKASIFADYSFIDGPLAGFGIGAGVRYTSESEGALPGPFNPVIYTGEESTLIDAIIRYDYESWRFAINGSNILDEEYVARCSGPAGCTYGAGRQVIATVTRKF
jgi:iron complex outermembrane receptor protein